MDQLVIPTNLPTVTLAFDYARLSRDRKKLSENIAIQHRESSYFIEDQGWEHGGSSDDTDITASEFGTKTRDGYHALIQDIKNVPDRAGCTLKVVIVVTEMPRLYRQLEELLDLIRLSENTKLAGIWTTDGEGYDLSTPEGYHRAVGAVNNARLESKRASKRQLRKKKAQAMQGKYLGGQRRYGFEGPLRDDNDNIINRDRINVEEIPAEIANWQGWYRRILAGESQMSIVRDNNRRGIPTPQGKQWTVGNFKRLMCQEAYIIFDAEGHPEDCPCLQNPVGNSTLVHTSSQSRHRARWRGLITAQQHEALLGSFQTNGQQWSHGMVDGRKYLLSGIAVCGGAYDSKPCEAPMYGCGRQLPKGYQRRYVCKSHDNHGERVACGRVFRDATALDAFVTDAVMYRLDSPEVARALATTDNDGDQAEALTLQLTTLRKRRELIRRQYARGEIDTLDEYKAMRAEADDAIDEVQTDLAKLRDDHAARLLPADGRIREAWKDADITWKRSIIRLIVRRIIVSPGHPRGVKYKEYRFNPEHVRIEWLH